MSDRTTEMPDDVVCGPRFLVAGFGAFPGAPGNPSQAAAERIAASTKETGLAARAITLAVEWDGAWPGLEAAIRRERPEAVLLVGLHARSQRFRVERLAFNEREPGRADAAGREAETSAIVEGGPARLESRLPMAAIARRLTAAGLEFEFSDDAGRYLCNDTLYRLAFQAETLGVRRYGFIHTPLTRELAGETGAPVGGQLVEAVDLDRLLREVLRCIADDLDAITTD